MLFPRKRSSADSRRLGLRSHRQRLAAIRKDRLAPFLNAVREYDGPIHHGKKAVVAGLVLRKQNHAFHRGFLTSPKKRRKKI